MNEVKRVLLLDDHPLFRTGLRATLEESYPEFLFMEAGSLADARHLIETERPDIAILDITLPDGDGISFAGEVLGAFPNSRIFILSMHRRSGMLIRAKKTGCRGYFLKEDAGNELLKALRMDDLHFRVSWGMKELADMEGSSDDLPALYAKLTRREKDIFRLYAEGLGYKEIAWKLNISPRTASVHRYNIFKKLNISSEVELVMAAREVGLVE
ncbi:MAG: response regulator transcription factor [Spirochaetaceae bacterium]|nr:response regulator transcription factor [Spirochaetaceae bacterium]MDT8298990.1 response regulator transcription factor [Spirochaetaceae bacterium]